MFQSYSNPKVGRFFETRCSLMNVPRWNSASSLYRMV